MTIQDLQEAIRADRFAGTDHAHEEAVDDRLSTDEIASSVLHGEIIENYTDRDSDPRWLVLGFTPNGIPVHSVWEFDETSRWALLVTAYRPDPARWIQWRARR